MNPSARIWNIPPPPGTEDFEDLSIPSSKKEDSTSGIRLIDRIDPYLKNPEYVEFERKCSAEHSRYRSRSRSHSRERHHKRRYSRSRSRDRHRRSRSRSRSHRRRRRRSISRSTSKSPSHRHSRYRHGRRRRSSSRHSRSKSRSTSKGRSHRSHKSKSDKDKKSPTPRKSSTEQNDIPDADTNEVDMKIEEDDEEESDPLKDNVFKNDGTFLEMFKKMQEQQVKKEPEAVPAETKKPPMPAFGKRRGGKVLKTGLVQKIRLNNEEENNAQDAWSVYMKEVRRYKEACCDDDSKTRPLVK